RVEIPSGDVKLRAMLVRPDGAGPFPAIVALHNCDGLADGEAPVDQRYQEWGARLKAAVFAVLFPDSFGSRGLSSQCRIRQRSVRASQTRSNDADAARHWLQAQPGYWPTGCRSWAGRMARPPRCGRCAATLARRATKPRISARRWRSIRTASAPATWPG